MTKFRAYLTLKLLKANQDQNFCDCQCHAAMNPCLWFLVPQEFGCRRCY